MFVFGFVDSTQAAYQRLREILRVQVGAYITNLFTEQEPCTQMMTSSKD